MKKRIAIVVSHPIQHFCPQYVSFAENPDVELKVFFASALGYKKYVDPNFKKEIVWGNLQLEKFNHCFLNGDVVIQPDKELDAPSLNNELQSFQPDLLIIYGYFQKLQRRAHAWALKNNVKLAYISDSERRGVQSRLKELLKYLYIRNYFSRISYFLSVGNANEQFYQYHGVPAKKLVRMHFPIDVKDYQKRFLAKQELRAGIRSKYNIAENDIVLTVVGKLVSWKNQDDIIKAMQLLENENVKLHLFVLGSGDKLEEWQQFSSVLTKHKVHFPGFVKIDELPSYYAATDIYVHPAAKEPHSIAISEAIYMGCPIILSDHCGSYGESDDVQENKNGEVYPFGNINELADKIKTLALDNAKRKAYSDFSHETSVKFQQRSHYGVLADLVTRL